MTATLTREKFDAAAEILSLSEDYRVLRRFVPDPAMYLGACPPAPEGAKLGLFVDVETTGLDVRTDKIIELACLPFTFDADGVVCDAGGAVSYFNDPGQSIPPEVTAVNHITDAMVRGHTIDMAVVDALVAQAGLVVAHSADFDRKMLERLSSSFRAKHWACSAVEVPWVDGFGCRAAKLSIVAEDACRWFVDGAHHRAEYDCHLAIAALANARQDGRTALRFLLESARQVTCRVWATSAPFSAKDKLKARGYRWSAPEDGGRKCWYRDVRPEDVDEEVMFARDIAGAQPDVVRFGAKDRYSVRTL